MKLDSPQTVTWKLSTKDSVKSGLRKWLVGLLVLGGLGGGGFLVYRQLTLAPQQEARRRVQTVAVERMNLPITISANGTVQPERAVNVSPKNSGVLKQLLVKEGDVVKEGQILAYMDDSNLQGQITQAKAQLTSAQANLDRLLAGNRPQEIAQAEAQLTSAQANLDRLLAGNRPQEIAQAQAQLASAQASLRQAEFTFNQNQQLYKAGAIALREVENSRSAYDSAKAQVQQAQQALNLQRAGARPEEIAQARAQVKQAQEALNLQRSGTRQEEIAQARAEVKQAQEALALQKAGARPQEIAQARAEVKQAQEALDLQKAGSRPEEIAQARAQVMSAQGAMQTVESQRSDTVIRAPFNGVVTRKYADPGSFVTPTTSSSSVSSATSSSILALASENQVVAKVAETSIPQIKVGQNVAIEVDAYPGKSFQGKVTQVATQSTVEQNVTNFEVKMSLDDSEKLLRAGMNVNVEFQVGTLDNALVVPTVAIVRQEQGTGVFVPRQDSDRPRFKRITTGATVEDKTVVVSGLAEGDKVLISFPQGERRPTRTPSMMPGMGPPGGGGGGRRRG